MYTLFYYAGSQRIEERDGGNNPVYLYFYDAPGSDQILFRQDAAHGRLWYQYDLMGNTTHLSGEVAGTGGQAAGQVVEQYLYDAYGTPTVYDAAGAVRADGSHYDNRYLFKGAGAYQWLSQAQLYYCRARFYLPQHGRWLQPDPIGQAGGLNIYAYCGNDPVNGIDPSGLWTWSGIWNSILQSVGLGGSSSSASGSTTQGASSGAASGGASGSLPGDADRVVVTGSSVDESPAQRVVDGSDIPKSDDNSNQQWQADSVDLLFGQWLFGAAPASRAFGANSQRTKDMMSAPGVKDAINRYNQKNAGIPPGLRGAYTNYGSKFGLKGIYDAGTNMTQQFVGSYNVDIYPRVDGQIMVQVTNTTSLNSFLYGLYPEALDTPSGWIGGDFTQTYTWTQPTDSSYNSSGH